MLDSRVGDPTSIVRTLRWTILGQAPERCQTTGTLEVLISTPISGSLANFACRRPEARTRATSKAGAARTHSSERQAQRRNAGCRRLLTGARSPLPKCACLGAKARNTCRGADCDTYRTAMPQTGPEQDVCEVRPQIRSSVTPLQAGQITNA